MAKLVLFALAAALSSWSCRGPCEGERCGAVVSPGPTEMGPPGSAALAMSRTISVSGEAEILTAPDRFVVTVGFDLQADKLDAARDGSKQRAAALMAVAQKIPTCEVQTDQLSLQPRYEGYNEPGGQRIVGYQATRSLTVTLHALADVEGLLFDMLAAGANRVDKVSFHSSVVQAKRAEARLLAIEAARGKAEAMAAALGQQLGEPLRIEESGPAPGWQTPTANYTLSNETVPQISDTVATGKVRVNAGVSVVFALRPA